MTSSDLQGKVAFVTGAARGIGRAIAIALAEAGADVAVADLHLEPFRGERYYRLRQRWSGPEEEESTAEAVRRRGRGSAEFVVDVADLASVESGVTACERELGSVDVLVNNAGIVNNLARIAQMSPEAWSHELQVNLTGAFHSVRATVPKMAERGWGRVVNIASGAAVQPSLGQPAYAASKAGLVSLTRSVAQEFGGRGVTANAVLPGLIATPLVQSMPQHLQAPAVNASPVGRLGEPEEVASLVAYLASPAAGFITGVAIPCDGGLVSAPLSGLDG
jgi:NAD(P)-dependent dehydrogenase (short-subunit alcohol dehydrogenase family)